MTEEKEEIAEMTDVEVAIKEVAENQEGSAQKEDQEKNKNKHSLFNIN